jgi:hypothetical protein
VLRHDAHDVRAMSGNPIWWKNDVLYAVTMDFWDPQQPN